MPAGPGCGCSPSVTMESCGIGLLLSSCLLPSCARMLFVSLVGVSAGLVRLLATLMG